MTGKINMAKALCVLIVASFVMMSCVPALTVPPTPTTTPSKTSTPSSTPTLTPSLTATATATPNPSQIAEMLGLPIENGPSPYKHSYRMEGDNLMDYLAPIPTIAAQWVNGEWRVVTDNTVKYGALADSLGIEPLIRTNERISNEGDIIFADLGGVFTGEYRIQEYEYNRLGKVIQDYQGMMVFRNRDNEVVKVWVSMFSPDMPGLIRFQPSYIKGNLNEEGLTLNEALTRYLPGQRWILSFGWDGPQAEMRSNSCYPPPSPYICSENRNRIALLRSGQNEEIKLFVNSLFLGNSNNYEVPDSFVIPPVSIGVIEY